MERHAAEVAGHGFAARASASAALGPRVTAGSDGRAAKEGVAGARLGSCHNFVTIRGLMALAQGQARGA